MNRDNEPGPTGLFNRANIAKIKEFGVTAAWNALHVASCTATVCGLIITGLTDTLNPTTGAIILAAAIAAEISGWYVIENRRRKGDPDYQPIAVQPHRRPRL